MNKLILILLLVLSCSSVPDMRTPEKLDLSKQKDAIRNSPNIPKPEKDIILDTFEKAEDYCNSIVYTVNDLYQVIEKQKREIKILDEQAGKYRFWRNLIICLLITSILWQTRKYSLPIIKKLLGIPV